MKWENGRKNVKYNKKGTLRVYTSAKARGPLFYVCYANVQPLYVWIYFQEY